MYINVPNYEAEQDIIDRINAKTRHCRIGKVRHKMGAPWADKPWPGRIYGPPIPTQPQPWWMQGPYCDTTCVPPIKGYGNQCLALG